MNNAAPRWHRVRLDTIAAFRNGLNFSKRNFGRGIPIVGVGDFEDRPFPNYETLSEVDPSGIIREEHCLRENDIVFVRSNGNRSLIGRSMRIRRLGDRKITHSAFTIRVRIISEMAEPAFYAYFFRSGAVRQALSAHGGGTNISNLNQDILARLSVPLPPLATQRRIASILGAYDDLIENNTRRIAILEEMARRLYEEWFVHFRFPGHEQTRMVESPLGPIPDGWKVRTLAEIAEVNRSTVVPRTAPEVIEYIDIASVAQGRVEPPRQLSFAKAPSRARRVVQDGDVIWSCVRPNRR